MNDTSQSSAPALMGNSPCLEGLRQAITRAARVDAPVLVTGETGTGKELVASMLHQQSRRARGAYIAVNCAALPEGLFHAEVFGYERGAFTGADRSHPGRVAAAAGGTLLLDEIGDLRLDSQMALLRFLEQGSYEPLGCCQPVHADVRIVAATHVDLAAACRSGKFREDLYYRLGVLHLQVPPLRERLDDLVNLAHHFIALFADHYQVPGRSLSTEALNAMYEHRWPGNVRELRNRILQALVMSDRGGDITPASLGLEEKSKSREVREIARSLKSLRASRMQAERVAIERALVSAKGNVEVAAEKLKVSRAQLYRLIKNHHLEGMHSTH